MRKRNPIALDLRTPKYRSRTVQPKKGRGVLQGKAMARRTLLRKWIVKMRMFWADVRGHHGKVWDYEPGDYYMGSHKGHNKHQKK